MFNLTITIWPNIDGSDLESSSAGQKISHSDSSQPVGIGTSPPD